MNIFGGSKPAAQPEPAPLPARDDQAVKDARKRAQLAASNRRGRRATVLTGGSGVSEEATVGRPTATSGGAPKTVLG